jgi:putative transposase
VIASVRQGLKEDGFEVSISQLCRWFEVPRRTVYYQPDVPPLSVAGLFRVRG